MDDSVASQSSRVGCPYCDESFTHRGLTRHVRSAHNGWNSQRTSTTNRQGESDGPAEELRRVYNSPYIGSAGPSDGAWRDRWRRVVQLGGKQYDLPSGRGGFDFVDRLGQEIELLVAGESPSERVIVFIAVVLQRDKNVKQAKDIRVMLERRIQQWNAGEFVSLIQGAEEADRKLGRGRTRTVDHEHIVKVFHRLVLRGKIREAIRWLTEEGGSKILDPGAELDTSGKTVMDELKAKHPSPVIPDNQRYELPTGMVEVPSLQQVLVTAEHVEKVARSLHGGGGPGGSSSEQWMDYLLRYGRASLRLRNAVGALASKLANEEVPWESIKALVASRLVALDKSPGVRPVGIGECLRRILGKCMAVVTGEDVLLACGARQLAGGLSAGTEGAIHAMSTIFEHKSSGSSKWGFLIVDANNAFNTINRQLALWQVRMHWPRCARFIYNTYRGHAELVMRGEQESLLSQEGVTQGDPLSMLVYALSTIPLINKLATPEITQCWYADDSSAQGTFISLKLWWEKLNQIGPGYGYFPQGRKTFLVVHPAEIEEAKSVFCGTGITVVTGHRFLGGYIGQLEGKQHYVQAKVQEWVRQMEKLSEAGVHQPQSAHTVFCKSAQFRWQYLQRVLASSEEEYYPLRSVIRGKFIPAIVGGEVTEDEIEIFQLPVNKGGIAVTDAAGSVMMAHETSKEGSKEIFSAFLERREIDVQEHRKKMAETKRTALGRRSEIEDSKLRNALERLPEDRRRAISRSVFQISGSKASGWLSVVPLRKHNFDLSPSEFRDALAVRYKRKASNLPPACDGCGTRPFTTEHALSCKMGGLVTRRHNEVRDLLGEAMMLAWGNCVKEPIITEGGNLTPGLRGDLACRGVWEPQREALFDVRVTDTDAPSYGSRPVAAIFSAAEEEKKSKYMVACEARRATFTPLVCSVVGHFAPQMSNFLKVMAERLSDKWGRPQGVVRGWLRARVAFAILRAASMCVRGARKRWRSCEELIGFQDGAAARL